MFLRKLNKTLLFSLVVITLGIAASAMFFKPGAKWSGVDESVVEKFAEQAGRTPWEPFINTDQGDLLLFVFLVAGAIGGFIAGYYYRTLFPPRTEVLREVKNV
jgi:ABC-type cobalt transport system substrate-binding protein